ncbi:hypothetical protein A3G67_05155 [Candidatus Roizmanbacteria bacterium RIFCSPLOWO2_12_FULL_40_12]|nr:MAG: hypothetical protein A2W49_04640 [Candidatus Roizmanbacteria bacterium RIFCSPHIGHO2_12_41_18]OGK60643.1 MAG: hypothetical protein A3G67_05155 [Candidatus Roizmanbacteria bacterium RIFCSPLOWO2_12_FULL_40_12]
MDDLTNRQTEILKALIKEYTESGDAIGSEILEKKYKLGVSPATIRNEMVELAKKGYLRKEYFSSGRLPSAKGFRFYIKNLMKEKELTTTDEVSYKNSIWDDRADLQKMLSHAVKVLAQRTGLLSLAVTNSGDLYYSGVGNLLGIQEFLDLDLSRMLFDRLDELKYWTKVLDRMNALPGEIYFMLGEDDFSDPVLEPCASIFGDFNGVQLQGLIGVVGPKRMAYEVLAPQVKYFSHLIEDIIKEQDPK